MKADRVVAVPFDARVDGGRRAMLLASAAALSLLALMLALVPRQHPLPALDGASDRAGQAYGNLPLSFIPNRGQTDGSVRYYAQGQGFDFYFTDRKAVLAFQKGSRGMALQLRFLGASAGARLAAEQRGAAKVSYIHGADAAKWRTGLPTYGGLAYERLWPGIDMRFRGAGGKLEYAFRLAAGASADRIRLAYAGADRLRVSRRGDLLVGTPLGTLTDSKPRAWQVVDGRRVPVPSRYSVTGRTGAAPAFGFELGRYDHSRPLLIDPGIVYSTYLGGAGTDLGNGIAIDSAGSAYVTGRTTSVDFPTTAGAFDTTQNSGEDAYIAKLNADGSALEYATFLGGSGVEEANSIAVDGDGSAYVIGDTTSSNYPTTPGALAPAAVGGDDAFVTKLSADGSSLAYSTYLGGTSSDHGIAIALGATGNAYVAGYTLSGNFPTTPGAFDTTNAGLFDVYAAELDTTGSSLVYSTFLGGSDTDTPGGITVDSSGSAYVVGGTRSAGFPKTAGAFDTTPNGTDDGFVTKLAPDGSSLAYSTLIGGSNTDGVSAVAVDDSGDAYITGFTASSAFPTTPNAFDTSYNDDGDAYVTKLDSSGSALVYSTFLGGTGTQTTGYDSGSGIAVDAAGIAYVAGRTDSVAFPTTTGAYDTVYNGIGDAFITKVDVDGSALAYSTYLGGSSTDWAYAGIAIDAEGSAYIAGYTNSSDFPTSAGAFDTTSNGGSDAFVTKFNFPNGYARPKGATPVYVSLTPSYTQCTSPNTTHGVPLAAPSCTPPAQASQFLTVGTPDSNGQPARAEGSVRLDVATGDPGTASDEADVVLNARMSDVRNKVTLTDYSGELEARLTLRITDRYNGVGGTTPATVTDTPLSFAVPCATTPGAEGSKCVLSTSADAVSPGAVREGKRAVWELGQVELYDGGADGLASTAPNTLFATQGIFVP